MQAVCTCFLFSLHEIPLARNSYTRDVSRMLSNLDTVPNVRSGFGTNRFENGSITSFFHENTMIFVRLKRTLKLHFVRVNFHSRRIKKRFEDRREDTKCVSSVSRNSMFIRSISRSKLLHHSSLRNRRVRFLFFLFFLILHKSANIHRSKYDYQLGVSLPFVDIIADKWQMQTSLTVTITGQPLSSNNMARQQIEFPISSIGKVLPFHHTRSQLSP